MTSCNAYSQQNVRNYVNVFSFRVNCATVQANFQSQWGAPIVDALYLVEPFVDALDVLAL